MSGSQFEQVKHRAAAVQAAPYASYENTSGFGAEKSLVGSLPNCCKKIKQLQVCSGKVDLDPSHP